MFFSYKLSEINLKDNLEIKINGEIFNLSESLSNFYYKEVNSTDSFIYPLVYEIGLFINYSIEV